MFIKVLVSLVFAVAPFSASAATLHLGGDYFLKGAESAQDDVYTVGESSTFAGSIMGDAVALGRAVLSDSDISEDALFIGRVLTLQGVVGDDARLAGETVAVGGEVRDDLLVIGGSVHILPTARIGGTLYIIAGEADMAGAAAGDVKILSRRARVSGSVGGTLESWGPVAIGDHAFIDGDFIAHVSEPVPIPPDARVSGSVLFDEARSAGFGFVAPLTFLRGFFSVRALMALTFAFALLLLARDRSEEVLLDCLPQFGRRLLRGVLIILCFPPAIAFLFASIIGIPLGIVLLCLSIALLLMSSVWGGFILGAVLERILFKQSPFPLTYRPVLLGTLLLSGIVVLPYIGLALHLVLLLAAAGSTGTVFYRHLREMR